jgi:hypothetical protein
VARSYYPCGVAAFLISHGWHSSAQHHVLDASKVCEKLRCHPHSQEAADVYLEGLIRMQKGQVRKIEPLFLSALDALLHLGLFVVVFLRLLFEYA